MAFGTSPTDKIHEHFHLSRLLRVAEVAHEDIPAPHTELPAVAAHLGHARAGPT